MLTILLNPISSIQSLHLVIKSMALGKQKVFGSLDGPHTTVYQYFVHFSEIIYLTHQFI